MLFEDLTTVDRIVRAWRERDPQVDSSSLEVTGRLLLCAGYYERTVGAVLRRFGLSVADFDVLNTLRRVGDQHGSKPSEMARSALIRASAAMSVAWATPLGAVMPVSTARLFPAPSISTTCFFPVSVT